MSFGAAVAPLVLEGDYSDWTLYDRFVDPEAQQTLFGNVAIVNKDEDTILLLNSMNLVHRKYVIGTKTLTSPSDEYWFPAVQGGNTQEATIKSILNTYAVGLIWGANARGNGIVVFKNATVIKTMTEAQLGFLTNRVVSVHISLSGKYIIVSGYLTAGNGDDMGWVVLVGS